MRVTFPDEIWLTEVEGVKSSRLMLAILETFSAVLSDWSAIQLLNSLLKALKTIIERCCLISYAVKLKPYAEMQSSPF